MTIQELEPLPKLWVDIQHDIIYQAAYELRVSFSEEQIKLLSLALGMTKMANI